MSSAGLKTRGALDRISPGQLLEVTTTDPLAIIDIPHLAQQRGDALVDAFARDGATVFVIRKKAKT